MSNYMENTDLMKLDKVRLKADKDRIKSNLKNVIHSSKFCALCLEAEIQCMYHLDFDENYADIDDTTTETMLCAVFGAKTIKMFASDYICETCQNDLKKTYEFLTKVKHSELILDFYLNQATSQIEDINNLLNTSENTDIANTIIVLHDIHMKEEIQEPLVPPSKTEENPFEVDIHYLLENTYICNYCSKIFEKKLHLINHIKLIHEYKRNCCPDCDEENCVHAKYFGNLHSRSLKCSECGYETKNKSLLISHINKDHLHILPHLCDVCGQSFPSKLSHSHHMKNYHQERSTVCIYCDREFRDHAIVTEHTKVCQNLVREFKCDDCPASFDSKSKLSDHTWRHSDLACNICFKVFKNDSNLIRHKINCHNPSGNKVRHPLKHSDNHCSVCQKKFPNKAALNHHIEIHRPGEKHKCLVCNKQFDTRKAYKAHTRAYTHLRREDPNIKFGFQCTYCDYSGPAATFLENHVNLYHLKIKPYVCNLCSKTFTTATHLKHHIETHEGIRKYQCSECSMMLCSLSGLKKHFLRAHADSEKPVACEFCNKCFVNQSEKNNHVIIYHSEKSLPCPLCGSLFSTRASARGHVRKVHTKGMKWSEFLKLNSYNSNLMDLVRDRRKPFVLS